MLELLNESLAWVNLPFTFLMIVTVVYWLLMIFGIVGLDSLDTDADAGLDLDADAGVDVDADADVDVDGDGDGDAMDGLGPISAYIAFINGDRVPVAIILSFFFVFLWILSILGNYFFNPSKSILIGLGIFVVNYVLATLLTKAATMPFAKVFGMLKDSPESMKPILGSHCKLLNTVEGTRIGQAEVDHGGSVHRLNVRSLEGGRIEVGSEAVVVDQDRETGVYVVKGF